MSNVGLRNLDKKSREAKADVVLRVPLDSGSDSHVDINALIQVKYAPRVAEDLHPLFSVLADWWHEATDAMSSPTQKTRHRAYSRIIAMRSAALPYILEDLRDRGGHWFAALEEITGETPPIPAGYQENVRGEKEAWLQWGIKRGLLTRR